MVTTEEYNKSVKSYYNNLYRFLTKFIWDKQMVKDIIQDCYLKLWERKKNIDDKKIKSWLFTTAHNAMIDYVKKKQKNIITYQETLIEIPIQPETKELKEIIDKALLLLPEIQRSIILLRDLEGYDYNEIGTILSLSESQVKVYLFRARKSLKDKLKDMRFVYENY